MYVLIWLKTNSISYLIEAISGYNIDMAFGRFLLDIKIEVKSKVYTFMITFPKIVLVS